MKAYFIELFFHFQVDTKKQLRNVCKLPLYDYELEEQFAKFLNIHEDDAKDTGSIFIFLMNKFIRYNIFI